MLVVIYTRKDTIEFWDPLANNPYFTIPSNNSSVRQFHFTAAYSKILIVTENDLSIFDLISKTKTNLSISEPALKNCSIQTCHFTIQKMNNIQSIDCSPNNPIFTVMLESGHVDIHCLRTGNLLTSIRDPDLAQGGMSGVCAKFSPDGFSMFTLLDVMSCIKCWSIGLTPFIGLGNIITITRNRQRAIGPKSRFVPEIENVSKRPRIR